jgi:regulator of protease activity HflC (stomatin/prohibitin superfamily)
MSFIFVLGVGLVLLLLVFFLPQIIPDKWYRKDSDGRKQSGGLASFVIIAGRIILGLLIVGVVMVMALVYVEPGTIVRIYPLVGEPQTLDFGYHLVAPWNKKAVWDGTLKPLVFMERGDEKDPNDAFGGQTADGDYITTVANITVRIDPRQMDEYVNMFGTSDIGAKLEQNIRGVLKDAFERSVSKYRTEAVMANKSKIVNEAREFAVARLEENFPIKVGDLTYPDIVATPAYEEAIRLQAAIRMETEKQRLERERNEAQAAANKAKADGEAAILRVQAEAEARAQEERAKGEAAVVTTKANAAATAVRLEAQAQADATLVKMTAEAKGNQALGEVYAANPMLLDAKRLDNERAVGTRWNGQLMPQFGGSAGNLGFTNYTGVVERLLGVLGLQNAPSPNFVAPAPERLEK